MPSIDDPIRQKKPFKKKSYRSYLALDETLEDVTASLNSNAPVTAAVSPEPVPSELTEVSFSASSIVRPEAPIRDLSSTVEPIAPAFSKAAAAIDLPVNKSTPPLNSRSRNIKDLSIFDKEIATPADYGDFMKVDAPVFLRIQGTAIESAAIVGDSAEKNNSLIPAFLVQDSESNSTIDIKASPLDIRATASTSLPINEKSELGDASAALPSASEAVSIELCDPLSARADPTEILQSQPVNTPTPLLDAHSFDLTTPAEVEPLVRTSVTEGLISTRQQTEHKVDTNRTQSGVTTRHKQNTNYTQSGHAEHVLPLKKSKTEHKVESQPDTAQNTKWTQTKHKVDTQFPFSSLVGLQQQFVQFLYTECRNAFDRSTEPLSVDYIAASLNCRKTSVKTTLQRLEQKGCIQRIEYKDGRGGWTKFRLPDHILLSLQRLESGHKADTNRTQSGHKVESELNTQPHTAVSSSSSFLDLTKLKTTTSEPEVFENTDASLSPEWARVDISCVSGIGFTKHQLVQLIRDGHLTPVEVGDSLAHFAFAYERGDLKKIAKPLGYLMSILRKPSTVPCPEGYETPLEASRRLNRETKRRNEERRQEEEREFQDLEFAAWRRELTAEKVDSIVPEVVRNLPKGREMALKSHFNETVWPEKRVELFGIFESEGAEIARQVERSLNFTNQQGNF